MDIGPGTTGRGRLRLRLRLEILGLGSAPRRGLRLALHLELDAAELDQVAGLERPHLAREQPLPVHERAAGALQVADGKAQSPVAVRLACLPAIRRGEFGSSWSARSKPCAPASALPSRLSPGPIR